VFKNVNPTEKKNLSTSGQISGNTEFTNVIIKFKEKNLSPACVTLPACSKMHIKQKGDRV